VSVAVVVRCEGTRPDMPCRGHLPIEVSGPMISAYTAETIAVRTMGWRFVTIDGRPRLLCASKGHREEES
jgi:hypothetical protein